MSLPARSPDFDTDAAIWDSVREETTGNKGVAAGWSETPIASLVNGKCEVVKRRCRTVHQSRAEGFFRSS